eukprot:TRINITY_DN11553_c0_g1_i1.p1 TRINITY_DN11553_c0_g1~~TRINITY_DN11553_c0_g1_i1.p1  ORF type:complete len:718 (+),score=54.51 TRINITY_DN11553_c0_g1_i1:314-2155(+)
MTTLENLNLSSNLLTSLPSCLITLPSSIRWLDLSANQIEELQPTHVLEHFGPKMLQLELNSNYLRTLPPQIACFTSLVRLDLSDNLIETLPQEFSHLNKLTKLLLNENNLFRLCDGFNNLTSLRHLDISWNRLYSGNIVLSDFNVQNFKSLVWLDMKSNRLSSPSVFKILEVKQPISILKTLTNLDLSNNQMDTFPWESLGCLAPHLLRLNLSNNPIFDISHHITQLKALTELNLSSTMISSINPIFSSNGLLKLENLNLSKTKIKFYSREDQDSHQNTCTFNHLTTLTSLHKIDVRAIKSLHFIPFKFIQSFKRLRVLDHDAAFQMKIPTSLPSLIESSTSSTTSNELQPFPYFNTNTYFINEFCTKNKSFIVEQGITDQIIVNILLNKQQHVIDVQKYAALMSYPEMIHYHIQTIIYDSDANSLDEKSVCQLVTYLHSMVKTGRRVALRVVNDFNVVEGTISSNNNYKYDNNDMVSDSDEDGEDNREVNILRSSDQQNNQSANETITTKKNQSCRVNFHMNFISCLIHVIYILYYYSDPVSTSNQSVDGWIRYATEFVLYHHVTNKDVKKLVVSEKSIRILKTAHLIYSTRETSSPILAEIHAVKMVEGIQ